MVAGDFSFDEMFYVDTFINQLPQHSIKSIILTPKLPVTHINIRNNNITLIYAGKNYLEKDWLQVLKTHQPQLVVLCDPEVLLVNEKGVADKHLSYFKRAWLEKLPCPLAVMDFKANLLKISGQQRLYLEHYEGQEELISIPYDYLIKICPPHKWVESQNPTLMQWKNIDLMPMVSVHAVKDETRHQLQCEENTKLVTVLFPMESLFMAIERELFGCFDVALKALIYYLNQIEGPVRLFVVNADVSFAETEFDNVSLRCFPTLELELVNRLLKSSDLFVTQSMTFPPVIQSTYRSIPAIVWGSSVGWRNQQFTSAFGELSPHFQQELRAVAQENPKLLFPYTTFPARNFAWPEVELFSGKYFFYLADMFNETKTLALVKGLLDKTSPQFQHFDVAQAEYINRMGDSLDAEQIVHRIVKAYIQKIQKRKI